MNLLRRTLVACFLVGASGVAIAGAASRPMVNPDPVSIPNGTAPAAVAKAIKRALLARNWTVSGEKPGHVEGTLNVRKHMLKVDFAYDGRTVTPTYVDSAELGYDEKDGKQYIHPKYTNWTRNVMSDLNKFLQNPDL